MSSSPTSSPTELLESANTLNIFALGILVLVIGFSCVRMGFRYNEYISQFEDSISTKRP